MARIKNAVLLLQLSAYLLITKGEMMRKGAIINHGVSIRGHCVNAVKEYLALVYQMYPGIVMPSFKYPEEPCNHQNQDSTDSSNYDNKKTTTIYMSEIPKGGLVIEAPTANAPNKPSTIDQFQYGQVHETDPSILNEAQSEAQYGHEQSLYGYGHLSDASYDGQAPSASNYGNDASNYGQVVPNLVQGISNYGHGVSNYENGASNYGHGVSNYDNGAPNYGHGVSNYDNGASNYGHGVSNYDNGASNYGHGVSNSDNGAPNYGHGVSNYDNGASNYDHGASPYKQGVRRMYNEQVLGSTRFGQTLASALNSKSLQHENAVDASNISSDKTKLQKIQLTNLASTLQHENYNAKVNTHHYLENIAPNSQNQNIVYDPSGASYAGNHVNMEFIQSHGRPEVLQGHTTFRNKIQNVFHRNDLSNLVFQHQQQREQNPDQIELSNVVFQNQQQRGKIYGGMQMQKKNGLRRKTGHNDRGIKELLFGYPEGQEETIVDHQGANLNARNSGDGICSDNSELCITVEP